VGGEEEIREGAVSSAGRQEWVSRAERASERALRKVRARARARAHVYPRDARWCARVHAYTRIISMLAVMPVIKR
jgi:hypothetical protein